MKSPIILLCICICITTSCANQVDPGDVNRHRYVQEKAKLHGVHSDLLRNTMQRLNLLIIDGIYTPLQLDEKEKEYLDELIHTAADLVVSVEILTEHIPVPGMNSEQRNIFRNLAEQLYTEASNVANYAENGELLEMDAAYQRLERTCVKCHSLFREK